MKRITAAFLFACSPILSAGAPGDTEGSSMTGDAGFEASLETYLARFDERKIRIREQLNAPATTEAIAAFESDVGQELPGDVKALYLVANGQISPFHDAVPREDGSRRFGYPVELGEDDYVGNFFGTYEFLSLAEARQEWSFIGENWNSEAMSLDHDSMTEIREGDPIQPYSYRPEWIPLAKDGGGNTLSIDLAPAEGGTVGQIIAIGPDESEYRLIAPSLTALLHSVGERGIGPDEGDEQRYFFNIRN